MIIRNNADLYGKIFLVTSISFVCFMSIEKGLIAGISDGLLYGIGMALCIGLLHQISTERLKADYSENLLGVHQVRVITLQQSFEDAFDTCGFALEELKKCRITQQDNKLGVLRARTGMTWKSFGEKIMLTVSPAGKNLCKVTASSEPVIWTTIVDYGKNIENIRSIHDSLRRRCDPITRGQAGEAVPDIAINQGKCWEAGGELHQIRRGAAEARAD